MTITKQILQTIKKEFKAGKFQVCPGDLPFEIQLQLGCSWEKALTEANRIRIGK